MPDRGPITRSSDPLLALQQFRAGEWQLLEPPRAGVLARAELEVELEDPLAWLQSLHTQASAHASCYWSNRDGTRAAAGIGAAARVGGSDRVDHRRVVDELSRLVGSSATQRAYGGFSFSGMSAVGSAWEHFGSHCFVVPRLELVRSSGRCTLACNFRSTEAGALPRLLAELVPDGSRGSAAVADWLRTGSEAPLSLVSSPGPEEWRRAVSHLLHQINTGNGDRPALHKAVLSRVCSVRFNHPVSPHRALARLRTVNPHAFQFLLQPAPGVAFFGASPERLVRVRHRRLTTEALAGTRPRGDSIASDRELEQQLLTSVKERHEHRLVHDGIRHALAGLCDTVQVRDAVSVRKLAHVQHLDTPFEGSLQSDKRLGDALQALHPTPAVGGSPRDAALAAISAAEPFDRGWYAAPFGWVDAAGGEFAVAIRSALAVGDSLDLYAGSGIVNGSDPATEWDETENKLQQLLEAI